MLAPRAQGRGQAVLGRHRRKRGTPRAEGLVRGAPLSGEGPPAQLLSSVFLTVGLSSLLPVQPRSSRYSLSCGCFRFCSHSVGTPDRKHQTALEPKGVPGTPTSWSSFSRRGRAHRGRTRGRSRTGVVCGWGFARSSVQAPHARPGRPGARPGSPAQVASVCPPGGVTAEGL